MKILILEDDPNRQEKFRKIIQNRGWGLTMVDTAEAAIRELKKEEFDMIFLDHDLGGEVYVSSDHRNTGAEVARFLNKNPVKCSVVIHSLNVPGATVMAKLIPGSHRIPGIWDREIFNQFVLG